MRRDSYQRLGRQDKFHVKNALKENAPQDGAQRALFNDLRVLLETKTNILRKAEQGRGAVEDNSGIQFGDTNIMQITQG